MNDAAFGFGTPACDVLVARAQTDRFNSKPITDALHALLSDDERERHARFRFDKDRHIYLVAHALVRRMLGALADVPPQALEFSAGERGRPEIAGPSPALDLRFNLSHTQGLVVCAAVRGRAAIGVDVEYIDRRVELLQVAQSVFSPSELSGLLAREGRARRDRFFDLWTLKEAYIKAVGHGLSLPLREISFSADCADPVPVHFGPGIADDPRRWSHHRYVPSEEHRIAVSLELLGQASLPVTQRQLPHIRHVDCAVDDLLTA